MWYWVDSLENGGGVYSCNFEGNKRSPLYSLLGSVPVRMHPSAGNYPVLNWMIAYELS